jgi:hypothetical protein
MDTALAGHLVGLVFDPFEFAQVEVLMDLPHEGIPEPLGHTVSAAARADIQLDAQAPRRELIYPPRADRAGQPMNG